MNPTQDNTQQLREQIGDILLHKWDMTEQYDSGIDELLALITTEADKRVAEELKRVIQFVNDPVVTKLSLRSILVVRYKKLTQRKDKDV